MNTKKIFVEDLDNVKSNKDDICFIDVIDEILAANSNKLTKLSLRKKDLAEIPKEIFNLIHLEELDLSNNYLSSLPKGISNLTNLKILNLSGNQIYEIPDSVSRLINLEELDLSENQLIDIPLEIFLLKKLKTLDLSFNKLRKIPTEIAELMGLEYLNLSINQLTELPTAIASLTHLKSLHLSANQLEEIPQQITELSNLKLLHLSENKLKCIPRHLTELRCLTSLSLSSNRIERIPIEITGLINLEFLDLRKNKLSELPEEISKIVNLRFLYLNSNCLKTIPKCIIRLANLKVLSLSFNLLNEIHKETSQLLNLVELNLDNNNITILPEDILYLPNLKKIKIDRNPLEIPPIEIASKGIKEISDYFESLKNSGVEKLYESKLIIVGQGGVGKTCLCRKLIDNICKVNNNEPTTEGICVKNWKWDWPINGNSIKFNVNIWDFGGQEIYHATHQFFLTKRSLYLLVWDARKEDEYLSFDYWLNIISLLSSNSPIIIVLNKIDERVKEIDQASLKDKFKNIVGFYKVSCLDGRGISELTNQIKSTIVNLPHVGNDWPRIWSRIRKQLEEDKRDYISYSEYKEICKSYDLSEEKSLYLSSYLHDLGVILHFQNDSILRNTVILKPEWGTNAVYKILDTKTVQDNKGRFFFNDLDRVWGDCKYPPEKYIDLLQLMIKFELCFKLIDLDEYIIPELLTAKRPEYEWITKVNYRLEYHYEFMPSGILTRFIVRNHRLIKDNFYWKNGAILNHDGTEALIISEPLNRKIIVLIVGILERELLAIIRNELNHIHETLNNPPLKEMIPCICPECQSGDANKSEYYELKDLKKFLSKNKQTIQCRKSLDDIPIEKIFKPLLREPVTVNGKNNIFISYSHKDFSWLQKLKTHLKPYEQSSNIIAWDDTLIRTGDRWFEKIITAIKLAKVAVFLVSPDFLASDFIIQHELPPFLEAARNEEIRIFWIAISSSAYKTSEVSQYQCANNPNNPLDKLSIADLNTELVSICEKLLNALY